MPYPNEHSARLQDPGRFNPDTFRRTDDGTIYGKIKVPATAAVIWGKLKGKDKPADNPIPQAIRFPTKNWTADRARKWLKDNNVKYIRFEPASGGKEKSQQDENQRTATIQTLLAQLRSQMWAMEAHALESLFEAIASQQTIPPPNVAIDVKPAGLKIDGSTAIIPIKGVLMREIPVALSWWGIQGTSYIWIQQQLSEALASEQIKQIRLDIDSPGGTVPGVDETAELIRAAREQKPIVAVVDDLCASAAYWLASQAERIEATKNSEAGSIGVFSVYWDLSARAKEMGVKVIVIKSGEHKAMGVPGAEISETQIAGIQQIIDGIAENFIAAVAAGRQRAKEDVRIWATGQLWLAETAKQLGVIDKVTSLQIKVPQSKEKIMDMTDEQINAQIEKNQLREAAEKEQRERLGQLKAAFPDDLAFAVDAFEKGLTVEQAKANYCDVLREKLKDQGKKTGDKTSGAPPIAENSSDATAQGDFLAEARQLAKEKGITMTAAMKQLNRRNPGLHAAFVQRCESEGKRMYQEAC